MAKALDFNKVKKDYLTITLTDENRTVLMVGTPTKGILDEFIALADTLDDDIQDEAIDDMYNICAKIMSRNKGGIEITSEFLSGIFDFEDIIIFIKAYTEFIQGVTNSKN